LVFFAAIAATAPANAQGRLERCNDYARDAVEQAQQNNRDRCGFQGPRWNPDRGAHFGWCMIVGPRDAEQETRGRQEDLRRCVAERPRENREGKRANCDTYAEIARVQAEANDKYNCGLRGGEWGQDKRPHFVWCMRNKREFMIDEIRYRAVELQKCFNRLGDYDDENYDRGYRRRF
jgi:hypothetical protein